MSLAELGCGEVGFAALAVPVQRVAAAGVDHAAHGFEVVGGVGAVQGGVNPISLVRRKCGFQALLNLCHEKGRAHIGVDLARPFI